MADNTKKILTVVCILILLVIASLYLVIKTESAKITTFEECEKAGWLVRSITVYDGPAGSPEKECVLWSGKSFVKEISQEQQRAVEIATAPLSYPVTIIEVKKLECQGCFSVKLQRDDNLRQFTIVLDNWEIKNVVQSDNVNVLPAPFFPTQKEPATSYMVALLSDKPEELIIKDGCLRAGGYLLVWPYGFSLSTDTDGIFQVIDNTGQPVARVGDKVRIGGGGGEMSGGNSGDITKYSEELPSRCSGPYWIVGEMRTVDKSTSSVATTPPIKPETSGFEEKMLAVGGTWEKDGWKLSVKAVDKTATPGFILISLSNQGKELGDARIETGKSYTYKGRNPDGSEVALFTVKASIFVGASVDAVRLALNWSIPGSDVQIIEAPVESEQMKTETPVPTPAAQASPEAPGFGMVLGIIGIVAVWWRLKK